MKHVEQLDRSGCGIACAAMVKGITYDQAREWWQAVCGGKPDRLTAVGNGAGLRKHELADLLDMMAVDIAIVEAPCIIIVKREHGRHFMVVTEEGTILDPLKP